MLMLIATQTVWIYWINTVPGQVSPSTWSHHRQVPIGASIALVISCLVYNWSILCLLNIPKWNGSHNLRQLASSQLDSSVFYAIWQLFSAQHVYHTLDTSKFTKISGGTRISQTGFGGGGLLSLLSWLHVFRKNCANSNKVTHINIGLFVAM